MQVRNKWGNVMRNYVGRPMGDMYMQKKLWHI